MKHMFKLLLFIIFIVSIAKDASAYIDPGTGSMFFQILIGFVLSAFFTTKIWWNRLKLLIYRLSGKKLKDEQDK